MREITTFFLFINLPWSDMDFGCTLYLFEERLLYYVNRFDSRRIQTNRVREWDERRKEKKSVLPQNLVCAMFTTNESIFKCVWRVFTSIFCLYVHICSERNNIITHMLFLTANAWFRLPRTCRHFCCYIFYVYIYNDWENTVWNTYTHFTLTIRCFTYLLAVWVHVGILYDKC